MKRRLTGGLSKKRAGRRDRGIPYRLMTKIAIYN